jgi:CRP-like cAMP-binding protein
MIFFFYFLFYYFNKGNSGYEIPYMNEEDWKLILNSAKIKNFKKGEYIIKCDKKNNNFYRIKNGKAVVLVNNTIVKDLLELDVFGDMSILGETISSADVVCDSPTLEIWKIHASQVWKIIELRFFF